MKEEAILQALEEVRDEHLLEAAAYFPAAKAARRSKRLVRVLLIAAVLTSLFSVSAFAVWQGVFHARVPEPDETITFHILDSNFNDTQGQLVPWTFSHVAMVISVDGASEGHWVLLRDHWLPETAASNDRLERYSFYDIMDFFSDHSMYVGWKQRPLEQILEDARLSADEARSWFNSIACAPPAPDPLLNITLYHAAALHDRPLLFGTVEGATAQIVREGTLGDWQLLELQVDFSEFFQSRIEGEPPGDLKLQNHVLLYEPAEKYLIRISGSDSAYDFETLEKIGQNLEVFVTDFEVRVPLLDSDYHVADLGRG